MYTLKFTHKLTSPPPQKNRFTISHGNRVSWLGWSLYVGYLPHYGGRFWDIRFKGERMAYELSLQEAMAGEGGGVGLGRGGGVLRANSPSGCLPSRSWDQNACTVPLSLLQAGLQSTLVKSAATG
jgi:hypothetical protein